MPSHVPDLTFLNLLMQLTRYDSDIAVRQEEKMRRLSRKHWISLDNTDKNGALVFQSLRDPEQKIIPGLPCPASTEAKRIRGSKGSTRLLLHEDTIFRPGRASFYNIEVHIEEQHGRLLKIKTDATDVPTKGRLQQAEYTEDITTTSKHVFEYWMPMWGRGSPQEASEESQWEEALETFYMRYQYNPKSTLGMMIRT